MNWVYFSSVGWSTLDGALPPVQYARALVARGERVLFVEMEPSRNPPQTDSLRVLNLRQLGLTEMEGLRAWYGQAYGALESWRAGVAHALDEFERGGEGRRVAVLTYPFAPQVELLPLLKARSYYLIYHVLDDYEAARSAPGYHSYSKQVEDYLIAECDLVAVLSDRLADKFKSRRERIVLARDGIAPEEWAGVTPRSVPAGPVLRLGFWGSLTPQMIDVELLLHVARSRPEWKIELIGPYDRDPQQPPIAPRLRGCANIALLGTQPHDRLREYLGRFDVCLVPAPVDDFNRARDPVKVYEYLAGYRPVVSTDLPQLAWLPYVYRASDYGDFITKLEEASRTAVDQAAVDRFLARQTWACRVDTLLAEMARRPARAAVAPFTPPPSNDKPEALSAFAAHLDRLVEQRTAQVRQLDGMLAESGIRPRARQLLQGLEYPLYLGRDAFDFALGRREPLIPPTRLMFDGPRSRAAFKENGKEFLRYFVELGGLKPDDSVLDVGCGIGRKTLPLTSYLSKRGRYEGFDIVKPGVEWCRKHIAARLPNFHFQWVDVYNRYYNPRGSIRANEFRFPYPDAAFDFVALGSVFTHMLYEDLANYLAEAARVLKPGGRTLITYFLLNPEARQLMAAKRSTIAFAYELGPARVANVAQPELAVAYPESLIRSLYDTHGLIVQEPIHYGSWCGRSQYTSYQDMIVATRPATG